MIELQQVTKCFNRGRINEFKAITDISVRIPTEKATVIKGPSGSGKTTLLTVIGCLTKPTSGRVWVKGQETTSLPERFASALRRSLFGFIFQQYNLIKGISAIENIMIPSYPTGVKRAVLIKRAELLLADLDMKSKARAKVEHLSGGEQQRVAIARAMINDPAIIIADEPTAHLDTDQSLALLSIFDRLKAKGKTLIIASHDPLVINAAVIEKTIGLRDGRVVEGGV
jgi:putative ABC transport system ATP-binding protein